MQTTMFTRKPLTVEAVQVTEENLYDVAEWCKGDIRTVDGAKVIHVKVLHPLHYKQRVAAVTDWILKSAQGYKIYADSAFKKGFEATTMQGTLDGMSENLLESLKSAKDADTADTADKVVVPVPATEALQFQTPKEV